MPKIKTSELSGAALDWAVCEVVGFRSDDLRFKPSLRWMDGGPLFNQYVSMYQTFSKEPGMKFQAKSGAHYGFGDTILDAACRAIVSAHLGDEVDIPEELV